MRQQSVTSAGVDFHAYELVSVGNELFGSRRIRVNERAVGLNRNERIAHCDGIFKRQRNCVVR